MKKILSLFMITAVIGILSCKKESALKPTAKPDQINTTLKQQSGVYDYQRAILEKRSAGKRSIAN